MGIAWRDCFEMNAAVREILVMVLIAAVVFVGMRLSVQTYIVYGPSMQPNYIEDEWVIVNKIAYKLHPPHRGDVVVLHSPYGEGKNFIKRVIGFPGESVEVKNSQVIIYKTDGTTLVLNEPYIVYPASLNYAKHQVPDGQYFVMGDNRNDSDDSRSGWTIPLSQIIGKAWIDIWPPVRWGLAPNYALPNNTAAASTR